MIWRVWTLRRVKDNLGWDLGVQLKHIPSKKWSRCGVLPKRKIKCPSVWVIWKQRERTETVFVWIILWTQRAGWPYWAVLPLCFVQCFDSYFMWPIIELHNAQHIPPVMLFNTAIPHLSQELWNLLDLTQFILSVLTAFRTVVKWHKPRHSLSSWILPGPQGSMHGSSVHLGRW